MIEAVHRAGSRIRHSRRLAGQRGFWNAVEPFWQRMFGWLSKSHGFATRINDDVFQLTYEYGARYDRQDQQTYERGFYDVFSSQIREGMVVIDVGAHVGLLTLGAARRVGKGGRVYAFEPAPESVAILRRHVQLNGFDDRVEIVEAVVSDVDGTTPFYVYGTSMSASLGRSNVEELSPQRFNLPSAKMVATELTVMSLSLDRFAASRKIRPNVMKIDVEGAELLVLTGARNLLLDGEIIVLCEVHPRQMLNCQSSVAELERFIHDIGYSLQRLDEPNDQGIFHTLISRSTYPAGGG